MKSKLVLDFLLSPHTNCKHLKIVRVKDLLEEGPNLNIVSTCDRYS